MSKSSATKKSFEDLESVLDGDVRKMEELEEKLSELHPSEFVTLLEVIDTAHKNTSVGQAGFHPAVVDSLIEILDNCFDRWKTVREERIENYLEKRFNSAIRSLEKLLEKIRGGQKEDGNDS